MAEIIVIAGPPGIGKTSASESILVNGELYLNQDYFYLKYREQNNSDPDKAGSDKFKKEIFEVLDTNKNFGYETNLGFNWQYEDLKQVITYKPNNSIQLHLFFTEDVNLCWSRADQRFNAGGHFVSDKTIFQMYHNTFTLLKSNLELFDRIYLYDVKPIGSPDLILSVEHTGRFLFREKQMPNWAIKNILPFLEGRLSKLQEDIISELNQEPSAKRRRR
jgi:predicted ABC-type ATPase